MNGSPPPRKDDVPRPWQPRFGIGGLMLVMLVCCVTAACGYYFMQFLRGGRQFQLVFILFTVAAPLLFVVAFSLARGVFGWLLRQGRRKS